MQDITSMKAETKLILRLSEGIAHSLVKTDALANENRVLKTALEQASGKIARLENTVTDLHEKYQTLAWRQMRLNIIFYNLPEPTTNSSIEKCEDTVLYFLKNNLKLSRADLYSADNLAGEIRIDIAHRMGRAFTPPPGESPRPRPMVTVFTTRKGRDLVMSQSSKLKGTNQSMSDQYPEEMAQCRRAKISDLKDARDKDGARAVLVRDKLLINGKEHDTSKVNPIHNLPSTKITAIADLFSSEELNERGSRFVAYAIPVQSKDAAASALHSLYQHPDIASVTHLAYAYSISGGHGDEQPTEGYCDGGEHGLKDSLLRILRSRQQDDILVACLRWYGGKHLGPLRFRMYEQSTQACLDLM